MMLPAHFNSLLHFVVVTIGGTTTITDSVLKPGTATTAVVNNRSCKGRLLAKNARS
jgi:hypothetical protein